MLSLQCRKATAVFVSSRDCDFVAEVENVVPVVGFVFFALWPSVFFFCSSIDEQYLYEYFSINLVRCDVFFSLYSSKTQYFFCPHFFVF